MGKFCARCDAPLGDAAKFCASCGAQTAPQQPPAEPVQHPPQYQPRQPQYQQPAPPYSNYPPPQPHVAPDAAPKPKKKRTCLILLIILGGFFLFIALIIGGIALVPYHSLNSASGKDHYELGKDQIPSVKLALGEKRKVMGLKKSIVNLTTTYVVTYSVPGTAQNIEARKYCAYLYEKDGFDSVTDSDFNDATGKITYARNSADAGYELQVTIDYNESGYTVTVVKEPGSTQKERKHLENADYYYDEIDGDRVPSIKLALGEKRKIGFLKYIPPYFGYFNLEMEFKSDTPNEDISAYEAYLEEKDGFCRMKSPSGNAYFGRDTKKGNCVVFLSHKYNAEGYAITLEIIKGKGDGFAKFVEGL